MFMFRRTLLLAVLATFLVAISLAQKTSRLSLGASRVAGALSASSSVDKTKKQLTDLTCTGTSTGLSSSPNDYDKLKTKFKDCVYVKGNVEISNFNPLYVPNPDRRRNTDKDYSVQELEGLDTRYDFSFLDNIKEISGYLLIHGTMIKNIKFKSLQVVRGQSLFYRYSIYIDSNIRLEHLDLTKLKEIENGSIYIRDNERLCHMNEVNWLDLVNNPSVLNSSKIERNGDPKKCPKCLDGCESTPIQTANGLTQASGCWFVGGCQNLSKIICHPDCEGRCHGPGPKQCCNSLCSGGCHGNTSGHCNACRKYQDIHTKKCVDNCEKLFSLDPKTHQIIKQEEGRYYLNGQFCIKECPNSYFVYDQYCVKHCPNMTYEFEKEEFDSAKNKAVKIRECKSCENERNTCQKTCVLNEQVSKENLKTLRGCEILKGNLVVMPDKEGRNDITETDLVALKNLKVINGNIRIQTDNIQSLNFLGNLEIIRPKELLGSRFALVVSSKSLKTIGLNKLRSIESGHAAFNTESLCLHDKINWVAITKSNDTEFIKRNPQTNCDGYKCDDACKGCWGNGPTSCQFCKTYKIEDRCVERCDQGYQLNGKYLYVSDPVQQICDYCHSECKFGCKGPTRFECNACENKFLRLNDTVRECMSNCPKTHYSSPNNTGECMPCHKDCDSCVGPANTISADGCSSCSSALVKNDHSLSIIHCIDASSYNCTHNMFWDMVKIKHPLQNKVVCRLCHEECDGCKDSGNTLGSCDKCKNYYSKTTNKCVPQCFENEYLNETTKECLPCHSQCENGCRGGELFQCTDCKNKLISLQDAKKAVHAPSSLKTTTPAFSDSSLVYAFGTYMAYRKSEEEDAFFCFEYCPPEMPYEIDGACSSEKGKSSKWGTVGVVIACILVFGALLGVVILTGCYFNKRRGVKPDVYIGSKEQLHLVNAEKLKKGRVLGKGAFGTVYEGFYLFEDDQSPYSKRIKVAIKVLSRGKSEDERVVADLSNELINEAKVMAKVDHAYCLRLLGMCVAEPMMLITELMEFSSVASFLSNQSNINRIDEKTLLVWSKQIAEGMEYLQSLDIVHRDLAARNILLKTLDHIKITDFGLAKLLESQEEGYTAQHNSMVPIKWLAIESINDRLFTHESDVWSYGVCVWEIFTFCAKPFSEVDPHDLKVCLRNGVRLAQPRLCQMEVYFLMVRCWLPNRKARPSFKSLKEEFDKMSLDPHTYLNPISSVDLDKPFKTINEESKKILDKLDTENDEFDDKQAEALKDKVPNGSKTLGRNSFKPHKSEASDFEKEWNEEESVPKYFTSNNSEIKTFVRKKSYHTEPKTAVKPIKIIEPFSKFKNFWSRKFTSQISTNSGTRLLSSVSTDSSASNHHNESQMIDLTAPFVVSDLGSSSSSTSGSSSSSTASYDSTGDKTTKFIANPIYLGKNELDNNANLSRQNSNLTQKHKISKFNRESSITNTNSDYLEPIISNTNVRQNQEYFGNYASTLKNSDISEEVNLIGFVDSPTPNSVIIMPEHYSPNFSAADNSKRAPVKDAYYNDEASTLTGTYTS